MTLAVIAALALFTATPSATPEEAAVCWVYAEDGLSEWRTEAEEFFGLGVIPTRTTLREGDEWKLLRALAYHDFKAASARRRLNPAQISAAYQAGAALLKGPYFTETPGLCWRRFRFPTRN